ncbi:hypothetical protein [Lacrimispora sp. 38-1]
MQSDYKSRVLDMTKGSLLQAVGNSFTPLCEALYWGWGVRFCRFYAV